MINNFDEVKRQLKDLSEVVNAFKSEAVQLKIVELVFRFEQPKENDAEEVADDSSSPQKKRKKRTSKKNPVAKVDGKNTPKRVSGLGASVTLGKLVEEGFFSKPKTIGDIIKHCEHNMARKFKQNEFSGKLGRLVRDKTLTRGKNADGQYEYKKP